MTEETKPVIREIGKIFSYVILGVSILAALLLAMFWIIGFLVDEPVNAWQFSAGVAIWIVFITWFIYMRTHAWSD